MEEINIVQLQEQLEHQQLNHLEEQHQQNINDQIINEQAQNIPQMNDNQINFNQAADFMQFQAEQNVNNQQFAQNQQNFMPPLPQPNFQQHEMHLNQLQQQLQQIQQNQNLINNLHNNNFEQLQQQQQQLPPQPQQQQPPINQQQPPINQQQQQPQVQQPQQQQQPPIQGNRQFAYSTMMRFIGSWRLNIFLMTINLIMLASYSLLTHYQHFRGEANKFQIEHIFETDKVPLTLTASYVFVICHAIYLFHKGLETAFLEWNRNGMNHLHQQQQQPNQSQVKTNSVLEVMVQENIYYYLVMYWFLDHRNIYSTFFEVFIFAIFYTAYGFSHSSATLIQDYIRKVIDTQVSFSSALVLRKDENFQRRIKKVENYYKYLLVNEITINCLVLWLFTYANPCLLMLLMQPGVKNIVSISHNFYNFRFQMNQALSYQSSDDQIVIKMTLTFFSNITLKFLDLMQHCLVIFFAGVSFGYFPMIQVYILTQGFKQFTQFTSEIDKYRKFRQFLRDLQRDYPLVYFGHQPREHNEGEQNNNQHSQYREVEDCAICKEAMRTARKLPCNHCFHWFCIIQLIESGSKNCPICRAEFNNVNRQQANANQNGQNNNNAPNGNSIFNFRLSRWLPNISIRMIRQRQAPVIPLNQAIDRIREIFPFLSQQQIVTEIRNAGGHIDQAILNITENIQRGMYPGVNI
eukprot:403332960